MILFAVSFRSQVGRVVTFPFGGPVLFEIWLKVLNVNWGSELLLAAPVTAGKVPALAAARTSGSEP